MTLVVVPVCRERACLAVLDEALEVRLVGVRRVRTPAGRTVQVLAEITRFWCTIRVEAGKVHNLAIA